ncbi:MAG TPA: hypothetical protein VI075_05510, partial [Methyloceanibacter sp.]
MIDADHSFRIRLNNQRVLIVELPRPVGNADRPALVTDPALICYYLFYPGHDEGLSGCSGVNEGKEFASFAGEWTCIAVLLDRPDANVPDAPKFVGLTNRNIGKIQVAGREERITMRIRPWSAMQLLGNTHPRFEVAKGSHAYFSPGETPSDLDPRTGADQSASDCGLPKEVVEQMAHSDDIGVDDVLVVPLLKIAAGLKAGVVFGPFGVLGVLAGAVWAIAEGIEKMDGLKVRGTPSPSPTVDTVGTPGKVVHPEGMIPPGVDSSRAVKWRSQDDLKIGDQQARPEKLVTPGETTRRDRWRRGRCGAGARGS